MTTRSIPNVGMDRYIVGVGDDFEVESSGIGPCFGVGIRSKTPDGARITALAHTSHLAPIRNVIEAVLNKMPLGANREITIEVAGGMAPFGDYPGTVEQQQEVMGIASSYGIAKTNFNLTPPEGPPLTMKMTPTRTSYELKTPRDTEEGKRLEDLLCLKDKEMQKSLDDSIGEMEDELEELIEDDGIGDARSARDAIQQLQGFYEMDPRERKEIEDSIHEFAKEFKISPRKKI